MRKILFFFIFLTLPTIVLYAAAYETLRGTLSFSHTEKKPLISTESILETVVFQKIYAAASKKELALFEFSWELSNLVQSYQVGSVKADQDGIHYQFQVTWTALAHQILTRDPILLVQPTIETTPYVIQIDPVLAKSISYRVDTLISHVQKHILVREHRLKAENGMQLIPALTSFHISNAHKHKPCKHHPHYFKLHFKHHSRANGVVDLSWVTCPSSKAKLLHQSEFPKKGITQGKWGEMLHTALRSALSKKPHLPLEIPVYETVEFKGLLSYQSFTVLDKLMPSILNLPFIRGFNLHRLSPRGPAFRVEAASFDLPEQSGFKDTLSRLCQKAKWACTISYIPEAHKWTVSLSSLP